MPGLLMSAHRNVSRIELLHAPQERATAHLFALRIAAMRCIREGFKPDQVHDGSNENRSHNTVAIWRWATALTWEDKNQEASEQPKHHSHNKQIDPFAHKVILVLRNPK